MKRFAGMGTTGKLPSKRALPRIWAVLCLVVIGMAVAVPADATRVVIKGRVIDSKVEGPQYPSRREECSQFFDEIGEMIKAVSEEHDACLADRSNANESTGGTCSKPACQKLHDTRDELGRVRHKGYSECNAAVNERQRSERWGNSGSRTDMGEFMSALKSGPVSAVKAVVKQEISNIIDKTFGFASPVVKGGLNAGMAAETMVSSYQAMQKACKEKSAATLNSCNREMLNSIQKLPSMVPSKYSSDPGIGLIQRAMQARLNLILRDTMDQMDRVSEEIDEVTESRPAPSRRRRVTPRIENN